MEENSKRNIKYMRGIMLHFMLFVVSLGILIWIGNYIFSDIPWVAIIVYMWGSVLVLHAVLVFALMGLFGPKYRLLGQKITRSISRYIKS